MSSLSADTARRAGALFAAHRNHIYRNTDRMFAVLMVLQWVAGIVAACVISPRTWIGQTSHVHVHVWAAIFLGGAISLLPVALALRHPGESSTRYTIAAAQMLMSSLLIHLTGGRIETHFHVFGSLAFLSFYRDWRVLLPATLVVAADHFLRGVFYPQSVFGVLTASHWRWLEHAGWVVFEDVFLVISCVRGRREMRQIAARTAQLDASEDRFRNLVEFADDIIYRTDGAGRFTFVNPAAERLMKRDASDLIGAHHLDLVAPEARPAAVDFYAEQMRARTPLTYFEFPALTPDGETLWFGQNLRLLLEGGEVVGLQAVARDITERKRAAEAIRKSEEYRNLFRLANDPILIFEPEGETVLDVNEKACEVYGLRREEFVGRSLKEMSKGAKPGEKQLKELLTGEARQGFEAIQYRADGTPIHFLVNSSVIEFQERRAILSINRDVTERKRADAALRESEHKFRTLLESMTEGLLQVDNEDRIRFANDRFCEMTGYAHEELLGRNASDLLLDEEGREMVRRANERRRQGFADSYEMKLRKKSGEIFWALVGGAPVVNADGEVVGSMGVHTDITERKRAEKQLLHNAFHDALTGLPNRALFLDHLQLALKRAGQHKRAGRPEHIFAVLFLDFDRFKIINDSLGHSEGDRLLTLIARRLEASSRPGDVVARLGGDEFTILVGELRDPSDALRVAERINADMAAPFDVGGREVFTTVSIGIAFGTPAYGRPEDLLRDADIAMYRAKAGGRARYQVFDHAMHREATARLQLETELRRALDRGEFRLHYQPIVELGSERVTGFEALVRWQHPERGLVLPSEFIPVTEETGLILQLGEWVLREACTRARGWQEQSADNADLTISVNLSCKQFMQTDLVRRVADVLRETGLKPEHLRLEITESYLMEDGGMAAAVMDRLRALGVELSIDDFGTGYSSLSYLHRLPVSQLKIDRSFVAHMHASAEKGEIVRTIIALAKNLGMRTVAEGVEGSGQLARLKSLGCEYGQGYLFSKPVSAEEVDRFIAATTIRGASPARDTSPGGMGHTDDQADGLIC